MDKMTIYVFIGEDNFSLDKSYLELRKKYQSLNSLEVFDRQNIEKQIANLGFFPEKKLFVAKNVFLNRVRLGKVGAQLEQDLASLSRYLGEHDFLFIDSDSKKRKYYQKYFPKALVKEFKIKSYLFNFLDGFSPGNLNNCFRLWQKAANQNSAELVLYMLKRRVRELLSISAGKTPDRCQAWQLAKLQQQLRRWSISRLKHFYVSLYNYEKGVKTGVNPLSVNQFMESALILYL